MLRTSQLLGLLGRVELEGRLGEIDVALIVILQAKLFVVLVHGVGVTILDPAP